MNTKKLITFIVVIVAFLAVGLGVTIANKQESHEDEGTLSAATTVESTEAVATIESTEAETEVASSDETSNETLDETPVSFSAEEIFYDNLPDGYGTYEEVASSVEGIADELEANGITLEDVRNATIYKDEDHYTIPIGKKYIAIGDYGAYVSNIADVMGSPEQDDQYTLQSDCYNVLYANTEVLDNANIMLDDLWDYVMSYNMDGRQIKNEDGTYEIVYEDPYVQSTDENGVYEIDYNGRTIVVNTNDDTVSVR